MKRSFLYTTLVLATMVIATGSRTFGDSKNRIGSGGSNRGQGNNNSGQHSGSLSTRIGNLSGANWNSNKLGNSGNGASGSGRPGGIQISGGSTHQQHGIKLPLQGLNGNLQNRIGQNQIGQNGHTILNSNGKKTKPIAATVAQILKHNGPSVQVQPQIQNIVATAPKHLCGHSHFSWWVNVCHNHCHTNYGCWNVNNQYWDCWTPCNWQVVQCQQFSYYVGMNCTFIPDMQAYGVQTVNHGSPAHLAGLLPGDLILTVNGLPVFDPNLVNNELVKGRLDLQVIRQGLPAPILLTVVPRLVQTVSF